MKKEMLLRHGKSGVRIALSLLTLISFCVGVSALEYEIFRSGIWGWLFALIMLAAIFMPLALGKENDEDLKESE